MFVIPCDYGVVCMNIDRSTNVTNLCQSKHWLHDSDSLYVQSKSYNNHLVVVCLHQPVRLQLKFMSVQTHTFNKDFEWIYIKILWYFCHNKCINPLLCRAITVTLIFDLWRPHCNWFILESKWRFVPNLNKSPQKKLEMPRSKGQKYVLWNHSNIDLWPDPISLCLSASEPFDEIASWQSWGIALTCVGRRNRRIDNLKTQCLQLRLSPVQRLFCILQ